MIANIGATECSVQADGLWRHSVAIGGIYRSVKWSMLPSLMANVQGFALRLSGAVYNVNALNADNTSPFTDNDLSTASVTDALKPSAGNMSRESREWQNAFWICKFHDHHSSLAIVGQLATLPSICRLLHSLCKATVQSDFTGNELKFPAIECGLFWQIISLQFPIV